MTRGPEGHGGAAWTPTPLKGLSMDFRALAPAMLKVARRLTDAGDAEDLVQDVLLAYVRMVGAGRVEDEQGRRVTLFSMLRFAALERRRIGFRRFNLRPFLSAAPLVGRRPPPVDVVMEEGEVHQEVWKALLRLPARWREVFLLAYEDGLGMNEVAQLLGISHGTARANHSRACALLRRHLERAGINADTLVGGGHDEAA